MTDDNEEIFRRAAEHYPLNTANSDWDAVRKKMEANPPSNDTTHTPKKRKYRPLLLLLLLLILSLVIIENRKEISNAFNGSSDSKKLADVTDKKDPGAKNNPQAEENDKEIAAATTTTAANEPGSSISKEDKTGTAPVSTNNESNSTAVMAATIPGANAANNPVITATSSYKKSTRAEDVSISPKTKTNKPHNKQSLASKQKTRMQVINAQPDGDELIVSDTKNNSPVTEPAIKNVVTDAPILTTDLANNSTKENKDEIKKNSQPEAVKELVKEPVKEIAKRDDKTTAKKDAQKKKTKQKHFYAGIIGGLDFSAIKLQSINKTGYAYGIVAGYRINNRVSIETGFLVDKKSYCSDGKYFSTKKLPIPSSVNIDYVSGDCHMYEVPLNVYYRFGKKTNVAWFASTGISSYFMSNESYKFDVTRWGQEYVYDAKYKNHDNQFAAVINFSAGYTHKIGRIGDLRLEPYLKLPVNKIGTGDLPIQSFGIMVGFTRFIF